MQLLFSRISILGRDWYFILRYTSGQADSEIHSLTMHVNEHLNSVRTLRTA